MNCTWIIPTQCISLCRQESSSRRNPFLSAVHLVHCTVAILRPTPSPLSLPLFERQEAAVDGFTVTLPWLPYPHRPPGGGRLKRKGHVFPEFSLTDQTDSLSFAKKLTDSMFSLLCRLQSTEYRFKSLL